MTGNDNAKSTPQQEEEEADGPWSPHIPSVHPYDLEFDESTMKSVPGSHIAQILDDYPTLLLQSDDVYPCLLEPQTIQMTGMLSSWHPDLSLQSAVYSGVAKKDGQDIEVAVKFTASIDTAVAEVANYGRLKTLQGSVIPRLYGVLFGFEKDSDEQVACLVMERFGSKLRLKLPQLDVVSRAKVLNCLLPIHHAGLSHSETFWNNIVMKDGEYRIIGLAKMSPHEETCHWNFDFVENASRRITYLERDELYVMCPMMLAAADDALYWNVGKLYLSGNGYQVDADSSLPESHEVFQFDHLDKYSMDHAQQLKNWTSYDVHRKWHAERNLSFAPRLVPDDVGQWIHVGVRGFSERERELALAHLLEFL
ncbi:hypothetical protein EIP91_007576 [Steccherinum ochraceum]|uniref:Protein kinase domain-containing protein n=1 Tax=Steccherinum ochraceum TaxID=92696 RepID=A0A4R0RL57_9APHY|nr:hypothetical protein EIP91_007576 [Steccherinum ochraceum]